MQIAYHIGANCTDSDRLLRSLMRSGDLLAARGIALPGPGRYRKLLRETVEAIEAGAPPKPETRDTLIDAITGMTEAPRMVLSNDNFLSQPNRIFADGGFYPMAGFRTAAFRQLFPHDDLSIFMSLRNPATFIPAAFKVARHDSISAYLGRIDPRDLCWSDVVGRIRRAAPDIPITLWCNEDAALLWDELLHRLAGVPGDVAMAGSHDLIEAIMQPEGFQRYRAYLASHPPASELQLRRVIGAFLDKYAVVDEIEVEIDLPGWDGHLVADLTRAYEEDIEQIAGMEGVTLLSA